MGKEPVGFAVPDKTLNTLAERALKLSHDVVAVSGFVDDVKRTTDEQMAPIEQAKSAIYEVTQANDAIRQATVDLVHAVDETNEAVQVSSELIRSNSSNGQAVAQWVSTLDAQMSSITNILNNVQSAIARVQEIALQVKILAINAKIEAARAGMAGRGFSVVAEEINKLSHKTSDATDEIQTAIGGLTNGIHNLRDEAVTVSIRASEAIEESSRVEEALTQIVTVVKSSQKASEEIDRLAAMVHRANSDFAPSVTLILSGATKSAASMAEAKERVADLIHTSESIVQLSVSMGGATEDAPLISTVQSTAERISNDLSHAVATGAISIADLFDDYYVPIPNTNPQQYLARHTNIMDRLLPKIQEPVLSLDPRIVFCAAVDRNGYLATHNQKFSQPQGSDPVWNAAHSRNRRLFNDRVGKAAGNNREPFLLQIYRRDMGGGSHVMMKDLSAPITVDGRHWGGLRLAYTL